MSYTTARESAVECKLCHRQQGTWQEQKHEGKALDVEEDLSQWFFVVNG
jgi:hypothetical protein